MYRDERERIIKLSKAIEIGDKAENIKEIADLWIAEMGKNTLQDLCNTDKSTEEIKSLYQAALKFHEFISKIISQAKFAKNKIEEK